MSESRTLHAGRGITAATDAERKRHLFLRPHLQSSNDRSLADQADQADRARLSTTAHWETVVARVPLLNEDDPATSPRARELLMKVGSGRGRVVNLYRALAHHPSALEAFTALGSVVYGRDSSLTRKQAELAYTTATVVNNCYY